MVLHEVGSEGTETRRTPERMGPSLRGGTNVKLDSTGEQRVVFTWEKESCRGHTPSDGVVNGVRSRPGWALFRDQKKDFWWDQILSFIYT